VLPLLLARPRRNCLCFDQFSRFVNLQLFLFRAQIEDLVSSIYSLETPLEAVHQDIDYFVDSGLYDKMRREHYARLEALALELKAENDKLNEHPHGHHDEVHSHYHHHEWHPNIGQQVGVSWPFPTGKDSKKGIVITVFTLLAVPAILAVAAAKIALWKGS
jgi:hypothetical protein